MAGTSPLRQQKDEERKARTRNALLEAAGAVFVEQGYHATLIADVVARAGVGQGTFYRHFESKRTIFEALFDQFAERLLGAFTFMTENLPTTTAEYKRDSLVALEHVAGVFEDNRQMTLFFLRDGPSVDKDFERRLEEMYDRFAGLAKFYLDHAVEEGFARPCNTAVVSQCIVGIAVRFIRVWLEGRFPVDSVKTAMGEIVDFAFQGFGPEGS